MGKNARQLEEWLPVLLGRVAQGCAAATIAIALLALGTWLNGRQVLGPLWSGFTLMSPGTAFVFLLLSGALLVGSRHPTPQRARRLSCAGATLVLLLGLLAVVQHLTGTDFGFERWLSLGADTFGPGRIGRVSPLAAGTFVVSSLALLARLGSPSAWRSAHDLAASAAAGVMVVGVLVLLGFWTRAAFVFGGGITPMAPPTAAAFVFLGAGLLAGAKSPVLTVRAIASLAVGFAVGLAASVALFVLLSWHEQSRVRGEFDRKAEVLAVAFQSSVKDTVEELNNVAALFTLLDRVDRSSFRLFVSQVLIRHPSIRAFAWNPRVTDRERAAVETAARREGFPAYQFTERHPDGRLGRAGRRPEYAPVLYVEPLSAREAALGFDTLSDPVRRAALEKAWDAGQAAATEPIMPAAGTPADLGMLIFQPVYRPGAPIETVRQRRGALRGFVVETLNLDALIRGALPDLEREGLEFRLVDATGTLSEKTIVASTRAGAATSSPLRFAMWMTVQDRQWRLELYAAPGYLAARRGEGGWLVLGSGLLLTIILGAYLLASARHTAEVSRLAEGLRKISRAVEYSPASVLITDTQGAIEYVNPKFTQVTGYSLEEVRGQNPRLLRSGEMPPEAYQRLWATITAGGEWRGEFHNRKKTGELFWEAASISPVRGSDGRITHYVAVKEDITEQKRIEEAAEIRTRQLEAIRAVTAEITRELDLHTLLSLITQRATELADAVSGGIYLWNDADQVLVPHAYYGAGWLRERFPRRLGEGLMGYVAQERRGVIVNDYRRWPLAHQRTLETTEITAVLAEPLVYRDRLLGVIAVQHHRGERTFDAADQDVLRLFAVQAAIAIENVRLYEAAIERGAELEALVSATRSVTSGLNLQEILDRILNEAARISGAPHVKVLLLDKTAGVLRVGALRGSAMPPTFALPVGLGSSGLVAKTGQPLYMADAQNDPRSLFATRDRELGIVTYLGLPIKRGDDVLGVLTFNTTVPRRYRPEELTFLTAFADQAAIAIENARLYERVRDHAATLEQQVRERTRDLEAALQLAEAASRAKAEFLTNMSHELRTPLNGILGFSELLLRQGQTFPRDKQDRFLRNIHTSGQRLFELVSQLLDCTTVEAGGLALDRRSVVPASALDEVVTEIRPLATRKGLVLRVEIAPDLPPMHADPVRFRQICSNLFTNAIKFTASGGMITIAARAVTGPSGDPAVERPGSDPSRPGAQVLSGPPAEWLELSVTDTGMGIRAEDMPRLFQQFTLLESVYTKRNAGSGIGLALTKRLVDLHGGRIWVESDGEGKGSTFRVVLPIADPAATRGPLDRDSGDRSPDCAESDGNADAVWNTDRTGQQREKGKR